MPNFDKHKNFHANKTEPHILCDMHTHSENSHDSACPISDMAEAQIKKGTAVFAVTDHYDGCYFDSRDIFSDIKNSVKDIDRNIKKFDGQIEILKGIELGEPAWSPEDAAKALELADFDVVIGSVHAVRYKDIKKPYSMIDFSSFDTDFIYDYAGVYFDEMTEMAETADFDILAHLTCPFRYINGKCGKNADIMKFEDKIRSILSVIIERKIALEVNTSGLYLKNPIIMPDEKVLDIYRDMGGRLITIGSDAHAAENAASGIHYAEELLKKAGFSSVCIYRKRIPVLISLN